MTTCIRHIGLVVSNFERSLKFWCDAMGFVVSRQMEESGPHIDAMMGLKDVRVTTAKLADPNGNLLELLCFSSHQDKLRWEGKPYSTGLTHIAITVTSMDETVTKLREHGVHFPNPPQHSPDGRVIVTYAVGPENILIEFVEQLT